MRRAVLLVSRRVLLAAALVAGCEAQDFRPPAGTEPARRRPGAQTILPGGRIIDPEGRQALTGPGPFGLAISPKGKWIVSADGGPFRYSLTLVEREGRRLRSRRIAVAAAEGDSGGDDEEDEAWPSVFMGLAFDRDQDVLFASEGNSGRVRQVRLPKGRALRVYDLNRDGYQDSYTGDLTFDAQRGLLYVVDQANFRVAVIDTRRNRVVSSLRVGRLPFAIALAPDARRVYVTNIGLFEYRQIPGTDPKRPRETGLPFPAFGFPSPEAEKGVSRETAAGTVSVPGLGNPNVIEANSVCIVNVENPEHPRVEGFVRTGLPFGGEVHGGSSPTGVLAARDRIFVSNGHNDSITVIDAATLKVTEDIPIRIPGLESYRGVLPIGLGFHEPSGWLLVAEAGINAVGVIDTKSSKVLGHIPAAWFPTRVVVQNDDVYVANAKGYGTGPNAAMHGPFPRSFQGELRRGSISLYPLPGASDLPKLTERVLHANGFRTPQPPPAHLPDDIAHVVLIVKENRTYDEVLGDITMASNGPVRGSPALARLGLTGTASGNRKALQPRLSRRGINVTPNHHAMAARWAFSDNFYADSEVSVDGHHWLVGSYPNAWTESTIMASYGGQKDFRLPTTAPGRLLFAQSSSSVHPEEQLEAGALWHHLERHKISFRNYGEGLELAGVDEGTGLKPTGARYLTNVPMADPLYRNTSREYPQYNMNIPDQYRADQFIKEMEERYKSGKEAFPRFLYIHLPNDHMARPRPGDGYPFEISYMADNDYALGRIVEYLSQSPWWRKMAILVTEDDAQGGVDHIDSHRSILLAISPYARKNYVSRANTSFPGLLKTIFRLLRIPPLNLFDASAADLGDCFRAEADFTPYQAIRPDPEIFEPEKAREPLDPQPSPRMDDPRVLREQHRRR
jgi:YVTN family beta-propeller protein